MAPRRCKFCNIVEKKDKKTTLIYESPDTAELPLVVFRDYKPASEHHFLVVPKEHIRDASKLTHSHITLVEKMVEVGLRVLREQGGDSDESNYRLGFHWPPFTLVQHLHLHVISPESNMGFLSRQIFRPNSWWFTSPECLLERLKKMPPEQVASSS